ncbi:unnamed protein product [Sphagnum jensenii]|uniref:Uncharacterized protein n=1 Tax=Sphagnum jensenii TaxID=128206 RepID=A0ABP1BJG5_9BRYO
MGHRKMDVKEAECVNDQRERQRAWEVRREARSRGLQVVVQRWRTRCGLDSAAAAAETTATALLPASLASLATHSVAPRTIHLSPRARVFASRHT